MSSTWVALTPGATGSQFPITYDGNSIDVVPNVPAMRLFSNIHTSNWDRVFDIDLIGVRYTDVNPDKMYVYVRCTMTEGAWLEPRVIISYQGPADGSFNNMWNNFHVLDHVSGIWHVSDWVTQLSHPNQGFGCSGYVTRHMIQRNQINQVARLQIGYGTDGYAGFPNGFGAWEARGMTGYEYQFVFTDEPSIINFSAATAAPSPPDSINLAPGTGSATHPTEYLAQNYPSNRPAAPTATFLISDTQSGAFYMVEARNASVNQGWVPVNNWSSSRTVGPIPLVNIYNQWYEEDRLEYRVRAGFRNTDGSFTPSNDYTYGSYTLWWSNPAVPRNLQWSSSATNGFKMNELSEGVVGQILWTVPVSVIDSGASMFELDAAEHAVSLGVVRDFDQIVRTGTAVTHTIGEMYGEPYPLDYLTVRLRTGFEYRKRNNTTVYTRYSAWVTLWDGSKTPLPDGSFPGYVTDGPWIWLSIPRGAGQPPLSEDFYRIKGMWEKEDGLDWLSISRRRVHILQEG